ncbi:hypothetical protein [Endozoicomonas sp. ALC066]|uniref:hypothetical protein n=1 Tax=Endozoicomonas sp. ALC066 TaxID=3403078 RepID=UPI003BB55F13
MDLAFPWYKSFRAKQHISDIRSNHKRRAALYDLLENYCQVFPSLIDVLQRIRDRKQADGDSEFYVFDQILNAVEYQNMKPLDAMAELFPADEVLLIDAASTKGRADRGFARAKFIAEKRAEAKAAIMMSMAYPAYIIFSTGSLFYFILSRLVPDMVQFLPVAKWPEWTQFLNTMYLIVVEFNYLVGLGLVGVVAFAFLTLKLERGPMRIILDRLPPWSVQKKIQSSVFLISLGDLIGNGDTFPKAVRRLQESSDRYLASYLRTMTERLEDNEPVAQALDCGLFGEKTTGFIKDFSSLPVFGSKIIEIGEKALGEAVAFIKVLAITIGLLGVIGAAGLNGYTALASNAIQKAFITEVKR